MNEPKRRELYVVVTRRRGRKTITLASYLSWGREGPARKQAREWTAEEPENEFGVAKVDLSFVWTPDKEAA